MFYDALGEHLAGIVWRVFLDDPTQQGTTACDREADREGELVAEGSVIHGRVLVLFSPVIAGGRGTVKGGQNRPLRVSSTLSRRGGTDDGIRNRARS